MKTKSLDAFLAIINVLSSDKKFGVNLETNKIELLLDRFDEFDEKYYSGWKNSDRRRRIVNKIKNKFLSIARYS